MTDRIEAAIEGANERAVAKLLHLDVDTWVIKYVFDAINLRELLEAGMKMRQACGATEQPVTLGVTVQDQAVLAWDAAIAKLTGPGE